MYRWRIPTYRTHELGSGEESEGHVIDLLQHAHEELDLGLILRQGHGGHGHVIGKGLTIFLVIDHVHVRNGGCVRFFWCGTCVCRGPLDRGIRERRVGVLALQDGKGLKEGLALFVPAELLPGRIHVDDLVRVVQGRHDARVRRVHGLGQRPWQQLRHVHL